MITLKSEENLEKYINENNILIVEYTTNICSACSSIEYKIDKYIEKNEDVGGILVPLEMFPFLSSQKNIFSAPTIEVYINQKLTVRKSGYFSLDEILGKISYYKEIFRF